MTNKTEWSRSFNGIGVKLDPQVVRVTNDFVLDVYLQTRPENCMYLAKVLREKYKEKYGEELQISARSLAIEIYGHYKIQKLALKAEELAGKNKACSWLLRRTAVIDCGAASEDNNRKIWDSMCKMTELEKRTGLVKLREKKVHS
ncbi:MAG: hypothetical protein MJ117_09595 [Lachnospiraceae bacterium]|nr:hypothetical protein [Lachnospiraceae bacterium]